MPEIQTLFSAPFFSMSPLGEGGHKSGELFFFFGSILVGSQHPSPNVKNFPRFEPQIWPEIITSRDAESTCFKGSRTSCREKTFRICWPNFGRKRSHHVMDASGSILGLVGCQPPKPNSRPRPHCRTSDQELGLGLGRRICGLESTATQANVRRDLFLSNSGTDSLESLLQSCQPRRQWCRESLFPWAKQF